MIFKWNPEILEASTLKSSKEIQHMVSIWSFTAVDFFDSNRLFVKSKIPELSPTLTLTLTACLTVIGRIASSTPKPINNVRA